MCRDFDSMKDDLAKIARVKEVKSREKKTEQFAAKKISGSEN